MKILKNNDTEKRFSIFPITHLDLWNEYKKAEKQVWVAAEVDLSKDRYDELETREKIYLKNILAFFAISDGLVIDNIATKFLAETDILEAQYFYGLQIFGEQVHAEGYSLLIDTYIKNLKEKNELFNSMSLNVIVSKKAKWAQNWLDSEDFVERLIAFACVEGIAFSSVFAGVFWFRKQNKMPGLCQMNEFIIKDESLHYDFAVKLYNNYVNDKFKLSDTRIREIVLSCAGVEFNFINDSMPDGLQGLTPELMMDYVKFVVDIVLTDLGCKKEYNISNPLSYMARIGLASKNNFFEDRGANYTRMIADDDGDMFGETF